MSTVETLTAEEISHAQQQASTIAANAERVTSPDQFVFFAAFDGTNNDKSDVARSGNPQDTNVAQLYDQAEHAAKHNSNMGAGYYPGPGTKGSRVLSSCLPPEVTGQVIDTATKAYDDFCSQASAWLDQHPGGSVTAMMTGFSRGGASAAIFSQLLWERGLVDPNTGKVLVPPGQVGVSAGLIYDPVDTGVSGNLAFAPNVKNITVVRAEDEYRSMFRAADYSGQPGVTTLPFTGNHCDIGGGYDNGLDALALQAGTDYFRNAGLNVADVDKSRWFDSSRPVVIHTEGVDDHHNRIWTEDAKVGYGVKRLTDKVVTAAEADMQGPDGRTVSFKDVTGTTIELTDRRDGSFAERTVARNGTVVETSGPATTVTQPQDANHSAPSMHEAGEFNIYGLDGNGSIHPALLTDDRGASDQYIAQWLNERGYQAPATHQPKNAG